MQHIIGHCFVHPHFLQPWSSHSGIVLTPALQHHAAGGAPQQCADLASRSPNASPEPVYLPASKLISSAREALARCPPEQVLQCLRPFADRLRVQGWTLLIADCGKSGEHHKALSVFQAVPQKNVWHHSALIAALGACGQCEQALQHLEQLKQLALQNSTLQPNHVTYSAAIAACARVQRLDRIMQLFAEMQERGLEPDSVTYYIVQSTAVRGGQWQLVEDMLQTMHSKGIPARSMVYAAYIRQLCRNLQWNHALGIFLIMQDLGVPATSPMITELLRTFNLCGKHRMAALLLKEAEAAGLVSSGGMYDSTLRGLLKAGHAHAAAELCKFMQQTGGWQPTSSLLDELQNGSTAVDQAAAAVEAVTLRDNGANGHAAAAVNAANQATEAQASNCNLSRSSSGGLLNQVSPQGMGVGDLSKAVSECLEHCESACYVPAAEGSCASDTETEKYAVSNESSSAVASVVSAPLAGSDSCYQSCSTSASTDSLCASTSSFSKQRHGATQGSHCLNTAVPDRASVNTKGQQQSQRYTNGRTSRRASRPNGAPQRFQHYSNGYSIQHGTYHMYQHNRHHQQQQGQHHRILPHVHHQQQHHHHQQQRHQWSRDGQRSGYRGVAHGLHGTHEQTSQSWSNYQQQQYAAQQQQQPQHAACNSGKMPSSAEAAVAELEVAAST